jgi:hypothetical protein
LSNDLLGAAEVAREHGLANAIQVERVMYRSLARLTASCACTTSILSATPAANRSRACVRVTAAISLARVATSSCSLVA